MKPASASSAPPARSLASMASHGTTIRQITDRAGVNVAAVNYHFRDKNELYIRVLREAKCFIRDVRRRGRRHSRGKAARLHRLPHAPPPRPRPPALARAGHHPRNDAPDSGHRHPVRELNEPLFNQVRALVRAVAGTDIPANTLDMLAAGVLGECFSTCAAGR